MRPTQVSLSDYRCLMFNIEPNSSINSNDPTCKKSEMVRILGHSLTKTELDPAMFLPLLYSQNNLKISDVVS